MKKSMKALLIALCAVLLVAGSIFGTLAYLTSSAAVVNTFTVGKVAITLDEAKVDLYGVVDSAASSRVTTNEYKLIPGHTYAKDPTIHVDAESEDCWLFAQIDNQLGTDATLNITEGWTEIDSTKHVYAYQYPVTANGNVCIFNYFTFGATADPLDHVTSTQADGGKAATEHKIVVVAYAVQADGFSSASAAWTATFGASSSNS